MHRLEFPPDSSSGKKGAKEADNDEKQRKDMPEEFWKLHNAIMIVARILMQAELRNLPKNLPSTLPVWMQMFAMDMRVVLYDFTGVAVPVPEKFLGSDLGGHDLSASMDDANRLRSPRSNLVVELDENAPLRKRNTRLAVRHVDDLVSQLRSFIPQDPRAAAAAMNIIGSGLGGTSGGFASAALAAAATTTSSAPEKRSTSTTSGGPEAPAPALPPHIETLRTVDRMLTDFVKRAKRRLVSAKTPSLSETPRTQSSTSNIPNLSLPPTLSESSSRSKLSARESSSSSLLSGKKPASETPPVSSSKQRRLSTTDKEPATPISPSGEASDDELSQSTSSGSKRQSRKSKRDIKDK